MFIDIGVYDGDTMAKGIAKFPKCNAYLGFEPHPDNCKLARQRFQNNKKVIIFPFAVGGANKLFVGVGSESHSVFPTKNNVSDEYVDVVSVDFVEWLKECPCQDRDIILKLNAEGVEYPILEAMINSGDILRVKHLIVQWHVEKVGEITQERHDNLLKALNLLKIPMESVRGFKCS